MKVSDLTNYILTSEPGLNRPDRVGKIKGPRFMSGPFFRFGCVAWRAVTAVCLPATRTACAVCQRSFASKPGGVIKPPSSSSSYTKLLRLGLGGCKRFFRRMANTRISSQLKALEL